MDRNVFNNWLCPNSLLLPKKSESPKIGGGGGGGGWGLQHPSFPRPVRLWKYVRCVTSYIF